MAGGKAKPYPESYRKESVRRSEPKIIKVMLGCLVFLGGVTIAAELSESHAKLLKESGIPLYEGA